MKKCSVCDELFKSNDDETICPICISKNISVSKNGSLRFNDGKPELSQLDPRFILALADLMTKSAKKYGKYNWAKGQEYHTPYDSCSRHLNSFMAGEDYCKESGLHHLLHAASNLMIMWTSFQLNDKDLDTRFSWNRVVATEKITEKDLENMCKDHFKNNDSGE